MGLDPAGLRLGGGALALAAAALFGHGDVVKTTDVTLDDIGQRHCNR